MQKGSLDVRQGGGHHRIVSDANYPQASAVESILAKRHTAGRCRTLWECCGGLLTHPSGRGYIMRGFQEGEMPELIPACQDPEIHQVGTLSQAKQDDWPEETRRHAPYKRLKCQKGTVLSASLFMCLSAHVDLSHNFLSLWEFKSQGLVTEHWSSG